ncbi:hypothetical protein PPYR_04168 [Photinus pyralis]|uniref:Serendipity locus protein alpha n=2 Tax=Photinus pyralis TaxID=7054 RepID=A0A5N4AX91_PHOPY|nr:uncharacterized protein LOC116163049 [Photinus pyralis]KAB0801982.1 hypothetical protein PPYR_04168 [Photinus pyralis]
MEEKNTKESIFKAVEDLKKYLANYPFHPKELILDDIAAFIFKIVDKTKDYCDATSLPKQEYYNLAVVVMHYFVTYDFFKSVSIEHKNEKDVLMEVNGCISKELISISQNARTLKSNGNVGSFINLMDTCLDKAEDIDISKGVPNALDSLNASSGTIEEILSFALSIGQVGYNDDNKIITAACRTVLNSVDQLKVEINKQEHNLDMFNLMTEMYTSALCSLEAKVNVAVLNLCLRIFSNYQDLVEDLYSACVNYNSNSSKRLDDLITDFDLHMDRIFQIALFSLACSSINKRTLDLQILVLHLLFLEKELVPSFVSMTTNHAPHRRKYANIFKKYWIVQMKKLRRIVHNIIEPEAYCKIIYEALTLNAEKMWEHISAGILLDKAMIDPFLLYTKELGTMIKTSLHLLNELKDDALIKLGVIHKVLHELVMAKNCFLDKTSSFTTEEVNFKLFKRCKVLLGAVKDLWVCLKGDFKDILNDTSSEVDSNSTIDSQHQTYITDNVVPEMKNNKEHINSRVTFAVTPVSITFSKERYSRDYSFRNKTLLHKSYSKCSIDNMLHELRKSFMMPSE